MKILFEHSGILPVKKYGGTERIIFWHMKELVRHGHEVFLIGHPESEVERFGIKLIARSDNGDWRPLIPNDVDLIHLFYTPSYEFEKPVMVTIEGNGHPGEKFHINTVFVSAKHAANHGSNQFVYNGLDFEEYPKVTATRSRWDDFLFLARASWKVKNLTHCVKACKKSEKNLHIAGGRKFSFSRKIRSYGMVDQVKKRELLSRVDALLWPVRWHEPFGIAIIEAYSAGIPVIGSSYGSLNELINEDVGVICNNFNEFQEVLSRNENTFNSDTIRNFVEKKFSVEVMTWCYAKCYERILDGESLNRSEPAYLDDKGPEDLLPF